MRDFLCILEEVGKRVVKGACVLCWDQQSRSPKHFFRHPGKFNVITQSGHLNLELKGQSCSSTILTTLLRPARRRRCLNKSLAASYQPES